MPTASRVTATVPPVPGVVLKAGRSPVRVMPWTSGMVKLTVRAYHEHGGIE